MTWSLATIISSTLGIFRDALTKQITQKIHALVSLFYFYISAIIFCTIISFLVFNQNPFQNSTNIWLARLFGVFFGIGVYGMFESIKINLTKTQVYGSYRNLVSIALSLLFLGELSVIDLKVGLAFLAFMISLFLPSILNRKKDREQTDKRWIFWIMLNIIFIGAGLFFVKLFVKELAPIVVLTNQYIGSLFVISLIILFKRIAIKGPAKYFALSFGNGVITALSMTFLYIAVQNGPVSTVVPLDNFIRTIATIPIGLFIFKESKKFTKVDLLSLSIALIGAIMLII